MYLPRHFEETRPDVLHALVRAHPLGLLITQGAAGLDANPLPFLLDADPGSPTVLRGHVARANPVWHEARDEVLVVFEGPHAYVSPSFYPSKGATGKVVPTWNYAMVQARGRLHAVEDRAWLLALVTRLTERHESPRPAPWAVGDAPADYIETMLGAIVGIEITIDSLVGKWKMSQNRAAADRDGVVHGLQDDAARTGDSSLAAAAAWVASAAAR